MATSLPSGVPILRAHNAQIRVLLPRMWQSAEANVMPSRPQGQVGCTENRATPMTRVESVEAARRVEMDRVPRDLRSEWLLASYGLVGLVRTGKRSGKVIVIVFLSRLIFGGSPRTRWISTFLPDSENFMFKRLGPISGDIMGSSLKVLTLPFKMLPLPPRTY